MPRHDHDSSSFPSGEMERMRLDVMKRSDPDFREVVTEASEMLGSLEADGCAYLEAYEL